MVINIGDAKAGLFDKITGEIKQVKAAVGEKVLKVIVETCYLTDDEKAALCRCVTDAGADFIKTSTGFGTAGATLADVELFKQHVGPGVRIKAAGGIRTAQDMEAYLAAGCARIGASAAIQAYEGRE
jgi:deoxyribose-phosphate aldolase